MTPIATWAINTGTDILKQGVNAGMGMLLGKYNDRRQLEQQKKLQELQIKGNKEMMDYGKQKDLEMWEATSYPAQKRLMQEAGLNPGLMYGMGGGGGQTTGGGASGVSGGSAPQGGGEAMAMMQMGLQMKMQKAQVDLIEAQAEKTRADTQKTTGVDTQEAATRIQLLEQGIDNERQKFEIGKLEITLKNMENYEKQASQGNRLDYIEYQTEMAMNQLKSVRAAGYIDSATINQKIEIIRNTAVESGLKNELLKNNIRASDQQIKNWVEQNMRDWQHLEEEKKRTLIQQIATDFATDPVNKATENISRFIDNIFIWTQPKGRK